MSWSLTQIDKTKFKQSPGENSLIDTFLIGPIASSSWHNHEFDYLYQLMLCQFTEIATQTKMYCQWKVCLAIFMDVNQ